MSFPGSPFRPIAISRVLNDQLNFRGAALGTVLISTQSLDSLSNPVLTWAQTGSWSTGHQFALIQLLASPAWTNVNTDALGLTQTVYNPTIINLGIESGSTAVATAISVLNFATQLQLFGAVLGFGTRVQVWATANGTQPSISAGVMQGTLVATFDDLFNPTTSTM